MTDNEAKRWPEGFINTGRLMIQLFRAFETRVVEELQARGFDDVTLAHLSVLRHLNPEGLRITCLADDAGVTKQAMGQMVRELKKRGYVETKPDPEDGRAKLVVYTPRGLELIGAAREIVGECEGEFQQVLGDDSYTEMRESLTTLLQSFAE